jgi:general stress protein 26
METLTNLYNKEAVEKLKDLVNEINICLFCTNLKTDDGATCRPMGAQKVDEDGNIWFFSEVDSDKNNEIKHDKQVQLFFAHPGKSSYLVVNGEAKIIFDKNKIEELWSPPLKTWFKQGKDDPTISIVKVHTNSAYYWDTDGNKMINFLKLVASVATGTSLEIGKEGAINVYL